MSLLHFITYFCVIALVQQATGECVLKTEPFRKYVNRVGTHEYADSVRCDKYKQNSFAFLDRYENLTHVELQGNFDTVYFDRRYTNIAYVGLDSTSQSSLKMNDIGGLTALFHLVATSGYIETLDLRSSDSFDSLEILDFRDNQITEIKGDFNNFKSLKVIYLFNNKLSTFDFSSLPRSMLGLHVSYNPITSLVNEKSLKTLPHILHLDLSRATAPLNAAMIPRSLKSLYVSRLNDLCHLKRTNLEVLEVSNSLIANFPALYLPESLKRFYLDGTYTTTFDMRPFDQLKNLEGVDMYRNPLNCTCDFFNGFIALANKTSVEYIYADCVKDSELAGYPFYYNDDKSFRYLLNYNAAHANCSSSSTSAAANVPVGSFTCLSTSGSAQYLPLSGSVLFLLITCATINIL